MGYGDVGVCVGGLVGRCLGGRWCVEICLAGDVGLCGAALKLSLPPTNKPPKHPPHPPTQPPNHPTTQPPTTKHRSDQEPDAGRTQAEDRQSDPDFTVSTVGGLGFTRPGLLSTASTASTASTRPTHPPILQLTQDEDRAATQEAQRGVEGGAWGGAHGMGCCGLLGGVGGFKSVCVLGLLQSAPRPPP